MNSIQKMFRTLLLVALVTTLFIRCEEDTSNNLETKGEVQFEITDAPIDDTSVKSVFVTVAEVKIDGQTFDGFSGKKTVDLMLLQNGRTEVLGLGKLEAGTYSEVSLVLDYETDASGNQPGCYVLTKDDAKAALAASSSSTQELKINRGDFTVKGDEKSNVVIDFDIRKAIQYADDNSSQKEFTFVTQTELESSLRFVHKSETADVAGKCTDQEDNSDKIVVFAYQKGEFNKDIETKGQGSSNIEFKNAVTSANVSASGNYQLSFLEKGEYELVFVSYKEKTNGELEMRGLLEINGLLGFNLSTVSVEAGVDVELDITLTGILFL